MYTNYSQLTNIVVSQALLETLIEHRFLINIKLWLVAAILFLYNLLVACGKVWLIPNSETKLSTMHHLYIKILNPGHRNQLSDLQRKRCLK